MNRWLLTILMTCNTYLGSLAQEVDVKATAHVDSIKVGEHIKISLSAISDESQQILFPSESHDFTPFEFVEKTTFTTSRIDSSRVLDSAIYTLRTFELGKSLELQLPVYFITHKGDSIGFYTEPISVQLKKVITKAPKEIKIKTTADFIPIPQKTNWSFWIALTVIILIVLSLILAITFKPLKRYLLLQKVTKKHQLFLVEFDKGLLSVVQQDNQIKAEDWIQHWKNHVAYLSKEPLNSFTTKDFNIKYKDQQLNQTLSSVDALVYGRKNSSDIKEKAYTLIEFSNKLFDERVKTLKNGVK